jgi:predicted TIM-barrel fold metal-dependent hydrolase
MHAFNNHFLNVPCECHLRRRFIKHLASASALGSLGLITTTQQTLLPLRMSSIHTIIFFHPNIKKLGKIGQRKEKLHLWVINLSWSVEQSLRVMDEAGVKKSILSLASTPGLWFDLPTPEVIKLVRHCNDFGASMVKAHPDRYGLFAALPMIDKESALQEIAYAFDTLKADGIGLQTNYGDKWPRRSSLLMKYLLNLIVAKP